MPPTKSLPRHRGRTHYSELTGRIRGHQSKELARTDNCRRRRVCDRCKRTPPYAALCFLPEAFLGVAAAEPLHGPQVVRCRQSDSAQSKRASSNQAYNRKLKESRERQHLAVSAPAFTPSIVTSLIDLVPELLREVRSNITAAYVGSCRVEDLSLLDRWTIGIEDGLRDNDIEGWRGATIVVRTFFRFHVRTAKRNRSSATGIRAAPFRSLSSLVCGPAMPKSAASSSSRVGATRSHCRSTRTALLQHPQARCSQCASSASIRGFPRQPASLGSFPFRSPIGQLQRVQESGFSMPHGPGPFLPIRVPRQQVRVRCPPRLAPAGFLE